MRETRNVFGILVGKSLGIGTGRPRRKLDNSIKLDLKKIRFRNVDWIEMAQVGSSGRLWC